MQRHGGRTRPNGTAPGDPKAAKPAAARNDTGESDRAGAVENAPSDVTSETKD
jgi:hypothetical protein